MSKKKLDISSLSNEERLKIKQLLLNEQNQQPDSKEKVGFLYESGKPSNEDYLLGKRIDLNIPLDDDEPEEDPNAPGAIFKDAIQRQTALDMQMKMREDPLYVIRKKEEEAKQRILSNPIKLKRLQELIAQKNKKKEKKALKEARKADKLKKKLKKQRKGSSDTEPDNDSSGDELLAKYLSIIQKKKGADEGDEEDSPSKRRAIPYGLSKPKETEGIWTLSKTFGQDQTASETTVKKESLSKDRPKIKTEKDNFDHHHSRVKKERTDFDDAKKKDSKDVEQKSSRHGDREYRCGGRDDRNRSHDSRGPYERERYEKRGKDRYRERGSKSRSPPKQAGSSTRRHKMSREDMERKRQEMMDDAKKRDSERLENVLKYRKEVEKETKVGDYDGGRRAQFVDKMINEHAEKMSVESRIKRNMHTHQKGRALDKKFTER